MRGNAVGKQEEMSWDSFQWHWNLPLALRGQFLVQVRLECTPALASQLEETGNPAIPKLPRPWDMARKPVDLLFAQSFEVWREALENY